MTDFVFQPMLTCIGNKRKLLDSIEAVVEKVKTSLGKTKLVIMDGFAGSTVVSRMFMSHASMLHTNDAEEYSVEMCKCFLQKPDEEAQLIIKDFIESMNQVAQKGPFVEGVVSKLYAPRDTENIRKGERCFYTRKNALIIDTMRKYIEDNVTENLRPYCLAPLLVKASIHTNTSGVFKGFHKANGIGCFGGAGRNALKRITRPIRVVMPVWYSGDTKVTCHHGDINRVLSDTKQEFDLIYLDPPYNQHPYGSNYFMLNVILENKEPKALSKVSGIPRDWRKSEYNYRSKAKKAMKDLLRQATAKSKYVLISYNDEGIITDEEWEVLLEPYQSERIEIEYDTFKGSRNLRDRNSKVIEIMYLVNYAGRSSS